LRHSSGKKPSSSVFSALRRICSDMSGLQAAT
jgi:hypothetical protein